MKKTLLAIALLAGMASADTLTNVAEFNDLTKTTVTVNGITWDKATSTLTGAEGALYTTATAWKTAADTNPPTVAHTSLALFIDLTNAKAVTSVTPIVSLGGIKVGLCATTSGLQGLNGAAAYGTAVAWNSLSSLGYIDGHEYTAITVSIGGPDNRYVGAAPGVQETGIQVFDFNGNNVANYSKLASGDNSAFGTITFDTGIVKGIAVVPEAIATTAGANLATAKELATHVPEPATATLGLLALAGLASRRRRK